MRRLIPVALAVAITAGALLAVSAGAASKGGEKTWKVTIENLTPPGPGAPGSQPLSPPLFVVHTKKVNVWEPGDIASHVVAAIAEDANNAPAESALGATSGVESVETGAGGPIPSGASRSYTLETSGDANRLSIVTMLVNTNDAFTGLHSFHVHGKGAQLETVAYDAGSERNNQLSADIPGPCCGNAFVRDPEGAPITMHPGLAPGVGDIDTAIGTGFGWSGPVARITIERVS